MHAQTEQDLTITGTVTSAEDGQPLIGAAVLVKGTSNASVTDVNGQYQVKAKSSDVLVISFIGFQTTEIPVNGQTSIDIVMTVQADVLDEVVVIGYGTQKKSHVTGSVSKAEGSNMAEIPVARADQALIGQVSGIQIINTNTEPGAAPKVQVRGVTSISATTAPLYVIDGYPIQGDLSTIDMNDVESIEVLKDAASTAIYGSRGANGVILVTTKSGSSGVNGKPTSITFNAYAGVKTPIKQGIYPTPSEWYNHVSSNLANMGLTEMPDELVQMQNLGTSTNWEDVMLRNGMIQNYQLGISGASKGWNYYVGGSYLGDEGVLRTNDYNKYNLRVNLTGKLNDWLELGVNVNPSFQDQQVLSVGLHDALRSQPWLPLYHTEQTLVYAHAAGYTDLVVGDIAHERHFDNVNGTKLRLTSNNSSLAKVDGRSNTSNYFSNIANAYLKATITEDISFRTSFGTFNSDRQSEFFQQSWSHRNGNTEGTYSDSKIFDWMSENVLNYNKSFGLNVIDVIGGFSAQQTRYTSSSLAANSFLTDVIPTLNAGLISDGSTYKEESALASFFTRANYAYNNKYMLALSARWDGSSRFGENNKWGFFPAASLGWRISQEKFFEPLTDVVNEFKLRATVGTTGNNGIPNYASYSLLSPVNSVRGGNVVQGFTPSSTSNPDLSWENTVEVNLGFDLGMIDNRLYASLDWFTAQTDKLLLLIPISSMTGFTQEWQNVGKMKNTGIDFELRGVIIDNKDFNWTASANISAYRNELVEFGGLEQVITTPDPKRPNQFIAQVGAPLVQYYGYVTTDEIPLSALNTPYWPVNVGSESIYVKDLNGDGKITDADRKPLGSPYPDFVWGFTSNLKYKAFDMSFVFQGSQGGEVFNIDPYYYGSYWKGSNNLAADEAARTQKKVVTDDMVQDASFIALRSLNFGYTLPKKWTKNTGLRVFFTGYNLIYHMASDYTSFNPEGVNLFTDNPLTAGYQRGAAPQYRSFALGVNFNF